jgi:hypothetical protein
LLWGMRPLGENPLRAAGQSCKHRNPWTDDSRRLKGGGGSVAAQGRCHGPSRRFDCPQLRLLRGDSIAVQFGKSQLPFFYRLRSLSGAPLDAGKHLLCVDALLRQFVQRLAGGMIGHMIPDARHKTYKTDFIEAGEVPALAGRRSIESGLGCPFQDGWRYHPPVSSCCAVGGLCAVGSVSGTGSAAWVSSAERMTADVFWMTSRLSASSAAFPKYKPM